VIALSFLICAVLSAIAFAKWRSGLLLTAAMAFAQDPLRKLVPNEPAYFNLLAAVVFAAALAGSFSRNSTLNFGRIFGKTGALRVLFSLFLLIVALESANSLIRFGSPLVTMIGLVNYLAPFAALFYASRLYAGPQMPDITKFLKIYLVFAIPAIATILLQQWGVSSPIFGEVGVGITINDFGTILQANSGIFRASEIAAWHVANAACVATLLLTYRRPNLFKLVAVFVALACLVYIGTLTGRRKFIVMIAIFMLSYVGLLLWFAPRFRWMAVGAALSGAALLLFLGTEPDTQQSVADGYQPGMSPAEVYIARTNTVFGDIGQRFEQLGVDPIGWAYNRTGLFGVGVGVGTQGTQHLYNFTSIIGGAAEGGLGRIMIELGAPGLIVALLFMAAIAARIRRTLMQMEPSSGANLRLACGLTAIMIANVASYSVAQQMFGDVFVMLFNGIVAGTLLTATAEMRQRPPARAHNPGLPPGPFPDRRGRPREF
jgi:hypothetical protein